MVALDARLKVLNGVAVEDLLISSDVASPTGRSLPVIDADTRASLITAVTRLTSILAAVDGLEGNTTGLATQATLEAARALLAGTLMIAGTVTGPLTNSELRASAPAVKDDYQSGECLAEQTGTGAVLIFTFSAPVHLVHVEGNGASTDVARVDPFGGTPTATLGFRASDEVGVYLPVTTSSVKVFAPSGMVIAVNGFRRT